MRRAKRFLTVVSGIAAVSILGTSVVLWQVVNKVDGIQKVDVFKGLKNRPQKTSDAANYLIVGSDDRTGIPRKVLTQLHAHGKSCNCTDTMMLVHVSKKQDKATIVSLPRDTYVRIPAYTDTKGVQRAATKAKLNSAYGMGGPSLLIETIEKLTGVTIDHYLEVNFITFVKTVDTLGKVSVCTPRALHDPKSGLDLPAGTSKLDGVNALKYVRARYVDPTADFGRMDRQQKFISSIMAKATSNGTLLNPVKLSRFINDVMSSIKTDSDLKADDLVTLATRLRNMSTSGVTFAQVPIGDDDYRVVLAGSTLPQSTVLWDDEKAQVLFDAIKNDQPVNAPAKKATTAKATVKVPAGNVRVRVYNAAGVQGLGRRASDDLQKAGFVITGGPLNATTFGATTTVIKYDPRYDESAKTLHASLAGSRLQVAEGIGRTMQVYVGSSYQTAQQVTVASTTQSAPKIQTKTAADNVCKKAA